MNVDDPAKIIWDYMQMRMELYPVDALFVLCSMDTRVAEHAAELYHQGYAPKVIVSGGVGKLTKDSFTKPEAYVFADILTKAGVPQDAIIIEDQSTNIGDNITFTHKLLKKLGLTITSFMIVQKPYVERRAFAAFKKLWPDNQAKILVTSPPLTYENYYTKAMPKDLVINVMVGDLQRIKEYPRMGFQIEQLIPDDVWAAYEQLVSAGYDRYVIKT